MVPLLVAGGAFLVRLAGGQLVKYATKKGAQEAAKKLGGKVIDKSKVTADQIKKALRPSDVKGMGKTEKTIRTALGQGEKGRRSGVGIRDKKGKIVGVDKKTQRDAAALRTGMKVGAVSGAGIATAASFAENEKKDRRKMKGVGSASAPVKITEKSGSSTKLEEKSGTSTKLKDKSGSATPTPRSRPKDLKSESRGPSLKNNMSMDKDKMATSIAAARKRGEGYFFDKKSGKKQLAIYKNDMKEGESLRTTANRLMGLKKR